MWLVEFPLRRGESWAWWTLLVSGVVGFASFLACIGYGNINTWNGVATLALLPCFLAGLDKSFALVRYPIGPQNLLRRGAERPWRLAFGCGQICLLLTAAGIIVAGVTIMAVGVTAVPPDLVFEQLDRFSLQQLDSRLIPLIYRDQLGLGGGLCAGGLALLFILWCGKPSRNWWQIIALTGLIGFTAAIGVQPLISYTDAFHLLPATAGALLYAVGVILTAGTSRASPRHRRTSHYLRRRCLNRTSRRQADVL